MGRGCGDGIAGVHHHIVGRRIGVDWSVGKPDWCCSCLGDCRWLDARDGLGLDARGSHCQRHWLLRQWSLKNISCQFGEKHKCWVIIPAAEAWQGTWKQEQDKAAAGAAEEAAALQAAAELQLH